MRGMLLTIALAGLALPLAAQDLERQEIIVTGSRVDQEDYSDYQPAVGLRKTADFLVQQVTIRGDTRDSELREAEIRAMLRKAIALAERNRVELAQGDYVVTRLTNQNVDQLELVADRRPDSQRIDFLIKTSLDGTTVSDAQERIRSFIKAVPEVGRAQMDEMGDPTLSVVGPDSYRAQIISQVADDAKRQASILGEDYKVELTGLNMPVQWVRSGPGEVLLYIPYEMTIVPMP